MADAIRIGILGAGGRMGRELMAQIAACDDLVLSAAVDRAGHPDMGTDIGGVALTDDAATAFQNCDCLIDFSAPGSTQNHAALAGENRTALVIGTTGLTEQDHAVIDSAAKSAPIVQAGNFSAGIALMMAAVEMLAASLPGDAWDIEILDRHHKHKIDSPSGTALMLGDAAAAGRGTNLDDVRSDPYDGLHGERGAGKISFAAQRGGAVIGEHDVTFYGGHERLTLSHKAEDRGLFAAGALRAARFAASAKPGRYTLQDVLGL